MKLKNKQILRLATLGALLIAHYTHSGEFRPFRPAIILIGGIKSGMAALNNEIERLESEAVGVPSLKEELTQTKQQLTNVKNKLGIAALEAQQETLKQQFDGFAQRFFKTAQVGDTFLYYDLNNKISDILNDPEISRKLDTIMRLKQEITERIASAVVDITNLGQQINMITRTDQRGLATIKTQLAMIQQQLTIRMLSDEARKQMDPLQKKIIDLEQKIHNLLHLRFTDDRLNQIERFKNRMRQYQLLLEYLRDPSIIPLTTDEKILAIE